MNDDMTPIAKIEIIMHKNGNVTIGGNIGNLGPALALLDHAKDCVRRYHAKLAGGERIVIPEYDTAIPRARHYSMQLGTGKYKLDGSDI